MNIKQYLGLDSLDRLPSGEQMSHEEKYTRIVNAIGLDVCITYLPASKEEIQEALKTDEYLNNIPLKKWDDMFQPFKYEFIRIGINVLSISGIVSTLKRTARIYAEMKQEVPV